MVGCWLNKPQKGQPRWHNTAATTSATNGPKPLPPTSSTRRHVPGHSLFRRPQRWCPLSRYLWRDGTRTTATSNIQLAVVIGTIVARSSRFCCHGQLNCPQTTFTYDQKGHFLSWSPQNFTNGSTPKSIALTAKSKTVSSTLTSSGHTESLSTPATTPSARYVDLPVKSTTTKSSIKIPSAKSSTTWPNVSGAPARRWGKCG